MYASREKIFRTSVLPVILQPSKGKQKCAVNFVGAQGKQMSHFHRTPEDVEQVARIACERTEKVSSWYRFRFRSSSTRMVNVQTSKLNSFKRSSNLCSIKERRADGNISLLSALASKFLHLVFDESTIRTKLAKTIALYIYLR